MTIQIPAVPTPVPTSTDPLNFDPRADALVAWFPPGVAAMNAQNVENNSLASQVSVNAVLATQAAATSSAIAASPAVQNAGANAAAAQAAAAAAQAYASQAQATNPDSPIRLNPARIGAAFTVPAGYNASSAGSISIDDGVTVALSDHSTWSIH